MSRLISTFFAEPRERGYCEVFMNFKDELAYIDYFDNNGKKFFSEDFPNKTIRYVEDAAENWALGIKNLT